MIRAAALRIATVFGVGALPGAPGTWASLLAALLGVATHALPRERYVVLCVVVCTLAVWSAHLAEVALGGHDDSRIVIDEFVGALISLAFLDRRDLLQVTLAVALFRVLDIVKPWPISAIDRRVRGGLGIVLDDVVAGVVVAAFSLLLP